MDGLMWLEPEGWATWRLRVRAERRAGRLTALQREALNGLLALLGSGARAPTAREVSDDSGASVSTVRRAWKAARELGLLATERTRRLVDGRWRQGPNRFTLTEPPPLVCPGGQKERAPRKKIEREASPPLPMPDRAAALVALGAVRVRRGLALWGWRGPPSLN